MAENKKKRQCISCGKEVEVDDKGNYKCANCGYDREAARERIRQADVLDKEKKEMQGEQEPSKEDKLKKLWGWS